MAHAVHDLLTAVNDAQQRRRGYSEDVGIKRWLRRLTAGQLELAVLDAIDRATRTSIGDLPEDVTGLVVGRVEPLDEQRLVSPISRRPVLAWGYTIASFDVGGKWQGGLPFALVDANDAAVIDLESSRVLITSTTFRKCRGVAAADDVLRPLLLSAGAKDPEPSFFRFSHERSGPSTYRFGEWVIEPGMVLAVAGRGVREDDPRATGDGYRHRKTRIRISGSRDHPVAITNEIPD